MFNHIIKQFEHYLLAEKMVAKNTAMSYTSDVDQFFLFIQKTDEKKKLQEITAQDTRAFLGDVRRKKRLSASSASRKLSSLKTFIKWAKKEYDCPDFVQGVSFPKLGKALPHHLHEQDIELILETASKDATPQGIRNKVMLCLMYVCGVRVSELVGLTISHIQFDSGLIRILGKGSKERLVPLPLQIAQLIKQYIEQVHPQLYTGNMSCDILFPVLYGGRPRAMTRQSFWMILKKVTQQSGLDAHVTPHVLRHSVATHLLKKGANLRLLQLILGHAQLETVQIYTHIDMTHLRKLYDAKHPRA